VQASPALIGSEEVYFEAREASAVVQNNMFYVYILQSKKDNSFYTGFTEDLKERLEKHNTGTVKYSSTKAPFNLIWYCAFKDKTKALSFEKYLKIGSGFAFARKRLV